MVEVSPLVAVGGVPPELDSVAPLEVGSEAPALVVEPDPPSLLDEPSVLGSSLVTKLVSFFSMPQAIRRVKAKLHTF
ncbi:hypothetical protein [Nannocystis pusilla]|uniref:hypothetical protein n=1 Tax=Nannocystis pusilla TaxID=889268 RepID=UPI003B7E0425